MTSAESRLARYSATARPPSRLPQIFQALNGGFAEDGLVQGGIGKRNTETCTFKDVLISNAGRLEAEAVDRSTTHGLV